MTRVDSRKLNFGDKIHAKFLPLDKNTVKREAKHQVGHVGIYNACWVIESGIFKSQWAMQCYDEKQYHWVPSCDLVCEEIEK